MPVVTGPRRDPKSHSVFQPLIGKNSKTLSPQIDLKEPETPTNKPFNKIKHPNLPFPLFSPPFTLHYVSLLFAGQFRFRCTSFENGVILLAVV